jgi:hypothetical protein
MEFAIIGGIIGAVGTLSAIVFGFIGYNKGLKKDSKQEGETDGTIKTDIKYITSLIENILVEQRHINEVLSGHAERLTRVEESSKQAHKRLDRMEGTSERRNEQ